MIAKDDVGFAATPPLECLRLVCGLVFTKLPAEDPNPADGMLGGKRDMALYGTRDAGQDFEFEANEGVTDDLVIGGRREGSRWLVRVLRRQGQHGVPQPHIAVAAAVLAWSCLPKLADAATAEPETTAGIDPVALVYYLVATLVLTVGCCSCMVGVWLGRRFERGRLQRTRTARRVADEPIPPPPTQPPPVVGQLGMRRAAPVVWTTTKAMTRPGAGVYHVDERCGGLASAGGLKTWRRCLRPECGGDQA